MPRTPTQTERASSVVVPGQPRKTPGAKSRHMVAQPETLVAADEANEDDEMQLVPTEEAEAAVKRENSAAVQRAVAGGRTHAATTTAAAPATRGGATNAATTGAGASRIGKPRQRPLSALSDNRHVDRLGKTDSASFKRSKGVKDLGTLFEGLAQAQAPPADGGRYNLRGGNMRSVSGTSGVSPPTVTRVNAGTNPSGGANNASPTRLPTRIPAKRRGTIKEKGPPINGSGPGSCQVEAAETHLMGPARSVRRRRSSLGAADVLA